MVLEISFSRTVIWVATINLSGWGPSSQSKEHGGEAHFQECLCLSEYRQDLVAMKATFAKAFPYQQDILALPVKDLDAAAEWYGQHFGMSETERLSSPHPAVIMARDSVKIGFAINGGDAAQDGAAILVSGIAALKEELESNGVKVANWRIDERDGKRFQVFFAIAPDGLCYYFHEEISH